jgi:hypothetical protein
MAKKNKKLTSPEYADDHAMEMFGKPYKELNADELEEFREEMERLRNKFLSKGGRVDKPLGPGGKKKKKKGKI